MQKLAFYLYIVIILLQTSVVLSESSCNGDSSKGLNCDSFIKIHIWLNIFWWCLYLFASSDTFSEFSWLVWICLSNINAACRSRWKRSDEKASWKLSSTSCSVWLDAALAICENQHIKALVLSSKDFSSSSIRSAVKATDMSPVSSVALFGFCEIAHASWSQPGPGFALHIKHIMDLLFLMRWASLAIEKFCVLSIQNCLFVPVSKFQTRIHR